MTSPPTLGNCKIQRVIQLCTSNLKNNMSHQESAYHDHKDYNKLTLRYCISKQGNGLRLCQSKDKGSHHEPACSVKL